jgi:Acyl-CoA carboxylase epsilon subunit
MAEPAQAQPPGSAAAPDPAAVAIVRGNPSAEQVAALVAVLAARARPAGAPAPRNVRSEWSSRSRLLRAPLQRGPGGWRASALPR